MVILVVGCSLVNPFSVQNRYLSSASLMKDSMSSGKIEADRGNGHGAVCKLKQKQSGCNGNKEKLQQVEEALKLLDRQEMDPTIKTFASLLQNCADARAILQGKHLHAHIIKHRLDGCRFISNLLIRMYGHCGCPYHARGVFDAIKRPNSFSWNIMFCAYADNGHLHDARSIFDAMPQRDLVAWNAMIAVYARHGCSKEALCLFWKMKHHGHTANRITFISVLEACTTLEQGREIHNSINCSGLQSDTVVGTALIKMYGKFCSLDDARRVFDTIEHHNVVCWTTMIAAYSQNGCPQDALKLFREMDMAGVKPDRVTFLTLLDACASSAAVAEGRWIHSCIVDCGLETDLVVGNTLINMYGKCGCLDDARSVYNAMHQRDTVSGTAIIGAYAQNGNVTEAKNIFDKLSVRDIVCWNAMIAAYAKNGHGKEAMDLFQLMCLEGMEPNTITFISLLDACATVANLSFGKEVHTNVSVFGYETDVVVASALVNMYGKCGSLDDARSIFDKISQRSVVCWNAMMATYARNGHALETLKLFQQMSIEDVKPSKVSFIIVLEACTSLAALLEGKKIHASMIETGLDSDVALGTALVNMYGKCGKLDDARLAFDKLRARNIVSWNAMIAAYAQNACWKESFKLFKEMEVEAIKPSKITFVNLLSACSNAGLIDDGWHYLFSMTREHDILPTLEHYSSMIDVIGRMGQLDEAEDLIHNMPLNPDALTWMTLLGACRIHGDAERGAHIAQHALNLDPKSATPYVLLSNIYTAASRIDYV